MLAETLDNGVSAFKQKFSRRFERVLQLPQGSTEEQVSFSKAITSNLLGGIGYFYGDQVVDQGFVHEWDAEDDELNTEHTGPRRTPPKALFTATPSRSFFPRGFYWYVVVFNEFSHGLHTEPLQGRRVSSSPHRYLG